MVLSAYQTNKMINFKHLQYRHFFSQIDFFFLGKSKKKKSKAKNKKNRRNAKQNSDDEAIEESDEGDYDDKEVIIHIY